MHIEIAEVGVGEAGGIGTAFAAPIYSPHSPTSVFFVTAHHVVFEAAKTGSAIYIRFDSGDVLPVTIVASSRTRPNGDDIAVLQAPMTRQPSIPVCSLDFSPGEAWLRGYATGIYTRATSVKCQITGLEKTREDDRDIVSLISNEFVGSGQDVHSRWRGMSGAPLVAKSKTENEEAVVAIITRIEKPGAGGRFYATPMAALDVLCREEGLVLDLRVRRDEGRRFTTQDLLLLLNGLEDSAKEHYAWQTLHGLRCSGFDVGSSLLEFSQQTRTKNVDPSGMAFAAYFLARIFFKNGNISQGLATLQKAEIAAQRASGTVSRRLSTLCAMRRMIESPMQLCLTERKRALSMHCDAITAQSDTTPGYAVYEVISAIGAEAHNIFSHSEAVINNRKYTNALISEHRKIWKNSPTLLHKQAVVSSALSILSCLWGEDRRELSIERLQYFIQEGRDHARAESNGLFIVQLILADAVSDLRRDSQLKVCSQFAFVAGLMNACQISHKNEGIRQILVYLRYKSVAAHALFEYFIQRGVCGLTCGDAAREELGYNKHSIENGTALARSWLKAAPSLSELVKVDHVMWQV